MLVLCQLIHFRPNWRKNEERPPKFRTTMCFRVSLERESYGLEGRKTWSRLMSLVLPAPASAVGRSQVLRAPLGRCRGNINRDKRSWILQHEVWGWVLRIFRKSVQLLINYPNKGKLILTMWWKTDCCMSGGWNSSPTFLWNNRGRRSKQK